jgi:hypothetical protein
VKPILGILLAGLMLGVTGCAHVDVVAPHGPAVYLAASTEPMPVERRWRTWFLAWGISPFDHTMPAEQIQREQLAEVRVIVEDNVPDAFLSILYNVIIPFGVVPQTVVLQGSRPPLAPRPPAAQ